MRVMIEPTVGDEADVPADSINNCRHQSVRQVITENKGEFPIDRNNVVGTVGTDIREATRLLRIVVAIGTVWWWVICKV